MDINSASRAVAEVSDGQASVSNASKLSAQERIFVDVFIANGGKAGDAARAAGYADASADVTACKLLCRSRVAEHIKNQVGKFAHSTIPLAVQTLVACTGDANALWKDRLKAANSLIDLAGVAPKGPGIQVNVGVVNGSQAQQIIAEVHDARARRLSDIPPAMPDKSLRQIEQTMDLLSEPEVDHGGGDHLQGPGAGTCPLPASPSENIDNSGVSGPASRFNRAFEEGDDA